MLAPSHLFGPLLAVASSPYTRQEGRPGIKAYRAKRKVKNRMAAISRRKNRNK